ncbi:hypothetical protein Pmani_012530 [Petrolisthes manimaculis]|uniref:Uncharacterized protein n=1 Tax=Petrolisthes manimaculis TaxID=1843537 RepID=A0AAE1UF00_9EUCA|nr:hypothetical protein Pmani_012530 [Petrolisthes manimaculis]
MFLVGSLNTAAVQCLPSGFTGWRASGESATRTASVPPPTMNTTVPLHLPPSLLTSPLHMTPPFTSPPPLTSPCTPSHIVSTSHITTISH